MMSIAHYFTFFRILIIPLFPLIYFKYAWFGLSISWMPYVLLFILAVCEFTDIFDGFIARKKDQVTDLGKVLDPMADSIMRVTVFFTFTQGMISLPLVVPFAFMYREFFITTLRTLCAMKGFALAARTSGKIKAVIQAVVSFIILILIIPYMNGLLEIETLQRVSLVLAGFAATYSILSAFDYIYSNREYIKKAVDA